MIRFLLVASVFQYALAAQIFPQEIVRRSLAAEEAVNETLLSQFTFVERQQIKRFDSSGVLKSVSSRTQQVIMIDGTPYYVWLARDDKPLTPEEQQAQREALKRVQFERESESRQERARRLEDYARKRNRYNRAIREIPEAFLFRLKGEELIGSRPAYVIEATPRTDYHPIDRYAKLFPALKGTLWIDKTEYRWTKVQAELIEGVNFGWILVRVNKGGRAELERIRVDNQVWLPKRSWFTVSARVGLLKLYNLEEETVCFDHRKLPAPGLFDALLLQKWMPSLR